jgi:predicted Zn finger-like uncharacterized protein
MASIACPKCQARLKINKLPAEERQIQCPQCGHYFTLAPSSAPSRPGSADLGNASSRRSPFLNPVLAIGIVAVILLVGGGAITAFFLSGDPPQPEPKIVKNKSEPKKENPPAKIKNEEKEKKEEPISDPEKDKKRQDFTRLVIKAARDTEAKNFATAIASYQEALQLFPQDEEATKGLREAQNALAALHKSRELDDKLKEELAQLNKQGQDSLEKKQYAASVEFFKLALQKAPSDAEAARGLTTAQEALARDLDQQKKQADFDKFITSGRIALKAGRYADAIREFAGAQTVLPNNPLAISLQKQAEQELTLLKNQEERKQEFTRLMDLAGAALRNQRYDEAENAYRHALKLFPGNALAEKGLNDSQRLAKQLREDFRILMATGTQAMRDMRYQDAVNTFREATRLFPADTMAIKALREAEQALERVNTYDQAMRRASTAMTLKRYGDAVFSYNEALRAIPNDPLASQGLQEASRFFQEELLATKEFERKVQQASYFLKVQKYSEASQLLAEAAKLLPNHPQILLVQKQGRYAEAMGKGQTAMNSQNYKEAVRQFQLALAEFPADPVAQAAFTRARSLVK